MLLLHLEIFNNVKNITHYQWLLKQNINNFEICLLSSVTITFQNCVLIGSQYQGFVIFLNKHCKTSKPQKPLIQICIIVTSSSVRTNNSILVFLGLIKSGCYSRYGLGLAHRLWNDSWNSKSSYGKLQRLTTTTPEQIF